MTDEARDTTDEQDDWLATEDMEATANSSGLSVVGEDVTPPEPPTPYAVKLDNWGKRRGEDISVQEEFKPLQLAPEDAADLFGMSFEFDPELTNNCSDSVKSEYLKALSENPDYQALHEETNLDVMASELASLKFGSEYVTFKRQREQQQNQDAKSGKQPSPQEQMKREMQAISAANKATQQAAQDVQDLRDMQEAMGIGSEDGAGGHIDTASMKRMFKKLKTDPNLKRICELAGKYRMMARSKQRSKVVHGYDDMIGIVMDGDVGRLIPTELAMLGNKAFQMDAFRRFVERQMMCREYRAIQKVAKGPIMIGIDESGSMMGDRIANAKAMALAMAWVAKHQNRWCGMFGWSSYNQIRLLALPPRNWPTQQVLDWLSGFLNGGTHLPIEKMPEIYDKLGAQRGKTDIIIITDGETGQSSAEALGQFKKWKQEVQAKVIGISIADDSSGLKAISEEYYRISSLTVDNEAVGKALSV